MKKKKLITPALDSQKSRKIQVTKEWHLNYEHWPSVAHISISYYSLLHLDKYMCFGENTIMDVNNKKLSKTRAYLSYILYQVTAFI